MPLRTALCLLLPCCVAGVIVFSIPAGAASPPGLGGSGLEIGLGLGLGSPLLPGRMNLYLESGLGPVFARAGAGLTPRTYMDEDFHGSLFAGAGISPLRGFLRPRLAALYATSAAYLLVSAPDAAGQSLTYRRENYPGWAGLAELEIRLSRGFSVSLGAGMVTPLAGWSQVDADYQDATGRAAAAGAGDAVREVFMDPRTVAWLNFTIRLN